MEVETKSGAPFASTNMTVTDFRPVPATAVPTALALEILSFPADEAASLEALTYGTRSPHRRSHRTGTGSLRRLSSSRVYGRTTS